MLLLQLTVSGQEALSTFVNVVTALLWAVNAVLFLRFIVGLYRPNLFFAGHWRGTMYDDLGSLTFRLVLYVEHGQLSGQLYYEGRVKEGLSLRGFDWLPNDSTRFSKNLGDWSWRPNLLVRRAWRFCIGTRFLARFQRLIHAQHNGDEGTCKFVDDHTPYEYEFTILARVFSQRVTCRVATNRDATGFRCLSGELKKLRAK